MSCARYGAIGEATPDQVKLLDRLEKKRPGWKLTRRQNELARLRQRRVAWFLQQFYEFVKAQEAKELQSQAAH